GVIFGLLGPNGAGKTTMIRIILDILRADHGDIVIFGRKFDDALKARIGYLPEERGLYQKITVFECLKYFAELKEVKKSEDKIDFWLNKVDLQDYKKKRVEELSKGMQQKVQLVAAFIHNPELLILDEPFSGLDPLNTKLIKDILLDQKREGKTIILSTHQMDQVERMCDRILLINQGKRVLYGSLDEIKSNYKESVVVEYDGKLKRVEGVKKVNDYGKYAELRLEEDTDPQEILKKLVESVAVRRFERKAPSLNEIFIEVVENA
ncbi:MAG: ATP-binding cassette domain-containing protein, partial [Euryarchaeota archaeon]|nr:ATP-binding cassette domain-containing protein [Euryarchaeota archaeon]